MSILTSNFCIRTEKATGFLLMTYLNIFFLTRISYDNPTVNQSDRWLIGCCVDNQIYVINGRNLGDLAGRYTCHMQRVSNTAFFIASRSLTHLIHSMKAHDLLFIQFTVL